MSCYRGSTFYFHETLRITEGRNGISEILQREQVEKIENGEWLNQKTINYQVPLHFHQELCQWYQGLGSARYGLRYRPAYSLVGPVASLGMAPCLINIHNLVTTYQQVSVLLTILSQAAPPATHSHSGMFQKLVRLHNVQPILSYHLITSAPHFLSAQYCILILREISCLYSFHTELNKWLQEIH